MGGETQFTTNNISKMLTKLGNTADAVDVSIQSPTSVLFQYYLTNELKTDITLTTQVEIDDVVINASPGHGFVGQVASPGEVMIIRYGDVFDQPKVISVVGDAITIEMPISKVFPIAETSIIRGNINMNVDGSSTPVDFVYTNPSSLGASIPIDISKIIVTMQHGANVPDDDKFGGITALAKGMYFRKINGLIYNYGNYTRNASFRETGATVEYSDKAPAGTNGTNILFDIENIFGQVIRLDPDDDDQLLVRIRDAIDATAGMAGMTISLVGSFTSGE